MFILRIVFVRVGVWERFLWVNCNFKIFFLFIMLFWKIWIFLFDFWKFRIDFLFLVGKMFIKRVIDVLVFMKFLDWLGILMNELGVFCSCREFLCILLDLVVYVMLWDRVVRLVCEVSFSLLYCLFSGNMVIGWMEVEKRRNEICYCCIV